MVVRCRWPAMQSLLHDRPAQNAYLVPHKVFGACRPTAKGLQEWSDAAGLKVGKSSVDVVLPSGGHRRTVDPNWLLFFPIDFIALCKISDRSLRTEQNISKCKPREAKSIWHKKARDNWGCVTNIWYTQIAEDHAYYSYRKQNETSWLESYARKDKTCRYALTDKTYYLFIMWRDSRGRHGEGGGLSKNSNIKGGQSRSCADALPLGVGDVTSQRPVFFDAVAIVYQSFPLLIEIVRPRDVAYDFNASGKTQQQQQQQRPSRSFFSTPSYLQASSLSLEVRLHA